MTANDIDIKTSISLLRRAIPVMFAGAIAWSGARRAGIVRAAEWRPAFVALRRVRRAANKSTHWRDTGRGAWPARVVPVRRPCIESFPQRQARRRQPDHGRPGGARRCLEDHGVARARG